MGGIRKKKLAEEQEKQQEYQRNLLISNCINLSSARKQKGRLERQQRTCYWLRQRAQPAIIITSMESGGRQELNILPPIISLKHTYARAYIFLNYKAL